jgi:hypothetical protein
MQAAEKLAIEGGPKTINYKLPTISDISGRMFGDEEVQLLTERAGRREGGAI